MIALWNIFNAILPVINFILFLLILVRVIPALLRRERVFTKSYKLGRRSYSLKEAEAAIKLLEGCLVDGEPIVDYSIQEVPNVKYDIAVEFTGSHLTFSFPMTKEESKESK